MSPIKDKTGGNRGPRRAAALAVVAAVAVLTACGGGPSSSGGSASAEPATYRADLAYAQCMRTHGVPGFPDPNPSAGISISGQPHGTSPAARANEACEHLLPAGSTGTGGATGPATASPPGTAATDCLGSLPCYTPRQFRVAYGIQPLLDRAIDGREILVGPADVSTPAKFAVTFASYVRIAVRYAEVISQCQIGEDFSVGEDSWTSAEAATMNSALEYAAPVMSPSSQPRAARARSASARPRRSRRSSCPLPIRSCSGWAAPA
jgi:hypothetical protein